MEEPRRVETRHRKHQSRKSHHDEHKNHHSREVEDGTRRQRGKSKDTEKHHSKNRLPAGPPLSGDDNYVRRWLETAETEIRQDRAEHHQTSGPRERRSDDQPDQQVYAMDHQLERKRKRKPRSSSDSSIIDSPPRRKPLEVDYEESGPPARPSKQRHKTQKINPPDPEPQQSYDPPSSPVNENFQKRPRHKTREDRYQPKTVKRAHRNDDELGRKRTKKATKSGQKKVARKTGGELMQDFKSDKISNDRLTMRPINGPGLFNNGRASSPGRRRGVPDLAFSEMDFLQHSNRYQAGPIEAIGLSKSREKERQKASKVQNNLTMFFQANRLPLKEVESNRLPLSSAHVYSSTLDQKRRQETGESLDRMNRYQPQSLNDSENSYPGFDYPGPSFKTATRHVPAHIRSHLSSASLPSEKATSYVTWSETQNSPHTTSTRNRLANVEEARKTHSPTPESIRRIIEETGVYRNTGIRPSSRHQNRDSRGSLFVGQPQEHERSITPKCGKKSLTSSTDSNGDIERGVETEPGFDIRLTDQERRRDTPRSIPKEDGAVNRLVATPKLPAQERELSREADLRRNAIVEHFDRKQGWHQQPSPAKRVFQNPVFATRSEPPRTTLTPSSREEIARFARIQRPLTSTSRISNRSFLHPIPETEVEHEQEQRPVENIQNIHGNPQPPRPESELHPNYDHLSERNVVSAFQNRVDSSMGSLPTPDLSSMKGLDVSHFRSAQTTPFTHTTSDLRHLTSTTQELDSNIAGLRNSHYLGLPVRGGAGVNSNTSISGTDHPIYISQVMQPHINARNGDYEEPAYHEAFEDDLEYEDDESYPYPEDTQFEYEGENYQGRAEVCANQIATHEDVYTATQFDAEDSRGSYV